MNACRTCRHFDTAQATLECFIPAIGSLSSVHAASRADDGVCAVHARLVAATATCRQYKEGVIF